MRSLSTLSVLTAGLYAAQKSSRFVGAVESATSVELVHSEDHTDLHASEAASATTSVSVVSLSTPSPDIASTPTLSSTTFTEAGVPSAVADADSREHLIGKASRRFLVQWASGTSSGQERRRRLSNVEEGRLSSASKTATDLFDHFKIEQAALESVAATEGVTVAEFIRNRHDGKVHDSVDPVSIGELAAACLKVASDRLRPTGSGSFQTELNLDPVVQTRSMVQKVDRLHGLGVDLIEVDSAESAEALKRELLDSGMAATVVMDMLVELPYKPEHLTNDLVTRTLETSPFTPEVAQSALNTTFLNDPRLVNLWGMASAQDTDINLREGLEIAKEYTSIANDSATQVIVGVVDTGIYVAHPDLVNNLWVNTRECPNPPNCVANGRDDDGNGYVDDFYGWNFLANNGDLTDDIGHGTHCAGTVAATQNNSIGVAGVFPSIRLMGLRTLGRSGGTLLDAVNAYNYAIAMGAEVTSNSWVAYSNNASSADVVMLSNVMKRANRIVHVAAAGNDVINLDTNASKSYPAYLSTTLSNVVSVASHTESGNRSGFSNFGVTAVDVSAPGSVILSTCTPTDSCTSNNNAAGCNTTNMYCLKSGTSMATPHVSGIMGAMLSLSKAVLLANGRNPVSNPTLMPTPTELKQIIRSTVTKLGTQATVTNTGGIVKLDAAMLAAANLTRTKLGMAPVDPSLPVDPVDPGEPTDPVDPTDPTDPTVPDCVPAPTWSVWSNCTSQCTFGTQSRSRPVNVNPPGATTCNPLTAKTETRFCLSGTCGTNWDQLWTTAFGTNERLSSQLQAVVPGFVTNYRRFPNAYCSTWSSFHEADTVQACAAICTAAADCRCFDFLPGGMKTHFAEFPSCRISGKNSEAFVQKNYAYTTYLKV